MSMRSCRAGQILAALSVIVGTAVAAPAFTAPALADTPRACHTDTSVRRTYTHGSPVTGLADRHGYYYLDVKPGAACPVAPGQRVRVTGTVHVLARLAAVGALPGVRPSRGVMYWLGFANADSGASIFPGHRYVTTAGETMPCRPGASGIIQTCVCLDPPAYLVRVTYMGPWTFGADVRFRVANETRGMVLTDYATLTVTPI